MKTKKVLRAKDADMSVRITVEITTGQLARYEHLEASRGLVSRIMQQIPTTRYLNADLCDVLVS